MTTAIAVTKEMIEAVAWSASPQEGMPWGMILDDKAIENILSIGLANSAALTPHGEEAAGPAPSTQMRGDDANSEDAIQARLRMQYRLGYNTALDEAANVAYRVCAETRHVTLGDKARDAVRALASEASE